MHFLNLRLSLVCNIAFPVFISYFKLPIVFFSWVPTLHDIEAVALMPLPSEVNIIRRHAIGQSLLIRKDDPLIAYKYQPPHISERIQPFTRTQLIELNLHKIYL